MGAILTDQASVISFRSAELTARLLRSIIRQTVEASDNGGKKISNRKLNSRGATEHIDLDSQEDLRALRKELRRYGVDYSIMKNPSTDQYEVWFLGKDLQRVHEGLKKAVAQWDKDAGRKPMAERFTDAKAEADRRNAERAAEKAHQKTKTVSKGAR